MIAWVFPGQGSQSPGMAARIAPCVQLFSRARSIMGCDLEDLCTVAAEPDFGPETIQPALFITSVGIARSLAQLELRPDVVAGHSLGELAALVATGALSFEDGLRLVELRGRAMAAAGASNPGGMSAVLGLDLATIEQICRASGEVWVANLNSPKQTVISGRTDALEAASARCREAGAKRVVRLQVPIASHCPLMHSARTEFEAALSTVAWRQPLCPVWCGADGRPHSEPEEIAPLLAQALTEPVRFVETVVSMRSAGVDTFVETGPGRILRGLIRAIDPAAEHIGVSCDEEAEKLAARLEQATEPAGARV
ncbi:MAG: ACP S-malonyltransferase [Actinomycetota bacterium]